MMRIGTFPALYPDELLYSVIARHHLRVGHLSPIDTLEQLFGTRNASSIYDFPNRLRVLCDRLPENYLTPDEIIDERSLLSVYQPFLHHQKLAEVRKKMMEDGKSTNIHFMLGAITGTVPYLVSLRYCRACVAEDRSVHGEAYWHRSHQFPGVKICYKHHEILVESTATIHSRVNRYTLHALDNFVEMERLQESGGSFASPVDIWLAEKVHWLLMNPIQPVGWDELKDRYVELLIRKGLATPLGSVKVRELRAKFTEHFGEDFLKELHCALPEEHMYTWILALVRKPRKATHPLRHLLFMNFLDCDPETILSKRYKVQKPFGTPPYPCLNPVCPHYRHSGAKLVSVKRTSETGAPVGSFYCDCGFSYARSGPDKSADDRFKRTRMIAFGPLWESELMRLSACPEISLRQKAMRLGVSTKTVENKVIEICSRGKKKEKSEEINIGKRAEYRETLSKTIETNPSLCPTQIRNLCKKEYMWLYRNDRTWMNDNMPNKQKNCVATEKVNWAERDGKYSEMIHDAIAKILYKEDKPKRITRSRIGEKIGKLSQILKNIGLLPKTKQLLETVTESFEEFQTRRILWVFGRMREQGESVKAWKIARRAGLQKNSLGRVEYIIECYERGWPTFN